MDAFVEIGRHRVLRAWIDHAIRANLFPTATVARLRNVQKFTAIPAQVPPEKMVRWGVVKSDQTGRLYVEWNTAKK